MDERKLRIYVYLVKNNYRSIESIPYEYQEAVKLEINNQEV